MDAIEAAARAAFEESDFLADSVAMETMVRCMRPAIAAFLRAYVPSGWVVAEVLPRTGNPDAIDRVVGGMTAKILDPADDELPRVIVVASEMSRDVRAFATAIADELEAKP